MKTVLRFGALLLLLGSALFIVGCQSMADPYGSDIANDPRAWELTLGTPGMMAN